jgi:hypothetical protein
MGLLLKRTFTVSLLIIASWAMHGLQENSLAEPLKDAVLHDSACTSPDNNDSDAKITVVPIRIGTRELGTIVMVQGACHCKGPNCDSLVYLRQGEAYQLAFKEKYASLHPMKIVKRGMPSLSGQFNVDSARMETTVYDWNGKEYRPSLCATVIKRKKVPSITQHACKAAE